jgi:NhaA family Na+:H+ antiporter
VAFLILPVFALANTAVVIDRGLLLELDSMNSVGILIGLVIGKPLGILMFSMLSVAMGFCVLPNGLKWAHVLGAGMLGGIGFTMSIFITLLAYDDPLLITESKMSILLASLVSGLIGYAWLRALSPVRSKGKRAP